jgi:tetratricopeptide (TPR) repeat protein
MPTNIGSLALACAWYNNLLQLTVNQLSKKLFLCKIPIQFLLIQPLISSLYFYLLFYPYFTKKRMKTYLKLWLILGVWAAWLPTQVAAQTAPYTVSGRVIAAEDRSPLPGVSVVVKGTRTGTVTDAKGQFRLEVPGPKETLVFSFVGFITKEVRLNNQPELEVVMQPDNKMLSEVVVTGYSSKEKKALVGAVAGIATNKNKGSGAPVGPGGDGKKPGSPAKTWKRSGLPENSIQLAVGDKDQLPLQGVQMAVQVDGFRARVLMDCYFLNNRGRLLEGTFRLRLPNGASPYFFAFGETVFANSEGKGGRNLPFVEYEKGTKFDLRPEQVKAARNHTWNNTREARVAPKEKAAYAYKETVVARIDPALMEWAGADVFNCRVNPLLPNQLHRIVVGYDVNLADLDSGLVFALSLPKYKAPLLVDFDVAQHPGLVVEPALPSFSHGGRTQFQLRNPSVAEVKVALPSQEGVVLQSAGTEGAYFATSLRAHLPALPQQDPVDRAVFLLDVSLSSSPDKFNIWLATMQAILANNPDKIKQFAVLCFNLQTFWWQENWVANNKASLNRLRSYTNQLQLIGATDLGQALATGSQPAWDPHVPKYLFLLSDGDATWGEDNVHRLAQSLRPNDKLFAFSTGLSGTHLATLDHLAQASGGAVFSLANEDEIATASRAFRLQSWRIERVSVAGGSDLLLAGRPRTLYPYQKIIVAGRGQVPAGSELLVQVRHQDRSEQVALRLLPPVPSGLARRVYGQMAVGQLEEFGHLTEPPSVQYATHFAVPGQTCSFVMLESEREYARFGIGPEASRDYVAQHPVGDLLGKLLGQAEAELGSAKAIFGQWMKKLATVEHGMQFRPAPRLDSLWQHTPEASFVVGQGAFRAKARTQGQFADALAEGLASDPLDYALITEQAEAVRQSLGPADALLVLSNFAERNPGDGVLMRDVAFSASEWGLHYQAYQLLKRHLAARPYEPPTYLALAQALVQLGQVDLALFYYEVAYQTRWDTRFDGFRLIAGLDYLKLLQKIDQQQLACTHLPYARQRLGELLLDFAKKNILGAQADLVAVITWNTDDTDVDLHVVEPSGEVCFYGHRHTQSGGFLSNDATRGFGPEMYYLAQAPEGRYHLKINYFGDRGNRTTLAKSKVYVSLYKNFGRPDEEVVQKVVLLDKVNRPGNGSRENGSQFEDVLTFRMAR